MKKSKVLNLYGNNDINKENPVKYSTLLESFMEKFMYAFKEYEYQNDIFDFSINTWNLGNMRSIIEESEFENIISLAKESGEDYELIEKMTAYKVSKFKEFTNFIIDSELYEKKGVPTLKVTTQLEDDYLGEMFKMQFSQENTDELEENYINRSAISIKPLQPFMDWHNNLYPDSKLDESDLKEVNIYLVNNSNYPDLEAYLKKKFDRFFMKELEGWHTDKKAWPQRRNYKMFKNWFRVEISIAIWDLEKTAVSKNADEYFE